LHLAGLSSRWTSRWRRPVRSAARNTIAVIAFENLRADAESDWYSRALEATFNTEVSRIPTLRLVASDCVENLRDPERSNPLRAARSLGVAWFVTGAYVVVEERIRIDARIVDAETGYQAAGAAIVGERDGFHELQERLARTALRSLALELMGEAQPPPPRGRKGFWRRGERHDRTLV
jgi:TolB-like protein